MDELRRKQIEQLRKAGVIAPEGESISKMDDGSKRPKLKVEQTVSVDKNTGIYSCPDCRQTVNPGCGNCFHSRYKGEDPLQPSDENLLDSKK